MGNGSRTSGAAFAALSLAASAALGTGCAGGEPAAPHEVVQALAGAFCSEPTFSVSRGGATAEVLLSARSGCGGAPSEYRFMVKAPGAADYAVLRDWSVDGDASWSVSGLIAGRHTLQVRVRPGGSAVEYDATATASWWVGDVCAAPATVTATVNGASLDLAATSTCTGAATAEYRFYVRTPGAAAYTAVRGWGTAPAASYPVSAAGRYDAVAYARAVGNLSDWEAAPYTSARVAPACGSAALTATPDGKGGIDLAATAACGAVMPEFRYLARAPGQASFVEIAPYGFPDRWLFQAPAPGRWEFQVWARAKGNASDWEAQATAAALVGNTCSAASLSASYDGSSLVTLEAASTCAGVAPEYRFLVRRPGATSFVELRPWDLGPTAYFTTSGPPGRYEFLVYARAMGNASTYEAIASASALVGATCSGGTLTATWDGSYRVDLAAAAACPGTPEFRFLVKRPGATAFAELRPYGASGGAAYDVSDKVFGRYEFQVQARLAGSISDWETAATASVWVGPTCTLAGLNAQYDGSSAIQLAGSATCTAGSAEYRFLVRRPGETAYAELRPYATDPIAQVSGALAVGRWEFKVWVRAAGNASDWEAAAIASVFVGPTCGSASLTAAYDGWSGVTLSAVASCTPGAQPQYRFLARPPGATAFAEALPWGYDPRLQYSLKPPTAGRWEFQVQVRAVGNTSDYEGAAKASVLVGPTCTSASLSTALVPPGAIDAIALYAAASCGAATPEYRFLARRPGEPSFSAVVGWGPSASVTVPGGAAGRYDFQVQVRAKGNPSDYEAIAAAAAFYGPACTAASLDARADAGGNVSLAADATCNLGATAEYRFLVRRPGEAAFGELRPWGAAPMSAYLPYPFDAGRYEFQVQVRAAGNVSLFEATATASALLGPGCTGATLLVSDSGGWGMRLTASSTCLWGPAEYRFQVKRPGDSAFTDVRPYDMYPEVYYSEPTPLAQGRYEFQVLVRQAGHRSDYEAIARSSFLTSGACSAAALTATPGADGVALSASATCFYAPPEYRFLARGPGETAFAEIRPYGPGPQFLTWSKVPPGRYEYQVQVRAQGDGSDWEATASATVFLGAVCSASGVTVSVPEDGTGMAVLGSASCRLATPEFRFLARQPGAAAFREIRPWSPDPLVPGFAPWANGQYLGGRWEFQAQVRAAGNAADESSATASALVGLPMCPGAALSATLNGGMVDLMAVGACKGTSRAQLRYLAKPPGTAAFAEVKPWSEDVVGAQVPVRPGRWEFLVQVRAPGNGSDWEGQATAVVLVPPTCTAASIGAVQDGSGWVRLQGAAVCNGSPEYRFLYRRAGAATFLELRPYGPDFGASWYVGALAPGTWEAAVQARLFGSASTFEATATVPVTIEAP